MVSRETLNWYLKKAHARPENSETESQYLVLVLPGSEHGHYCPGLNFCSHASEEMHTRKSILNNRPQHPAAWKVSALQSACVCQHVRIAANHRQCWSCEQTLPKCLESQMRVLILWVLAASISSFQGAWAICRGSGWVGNGYPSVCV